MNPDQSSSKNLEAKEEGPKIKINLFFSGHTDEENVKPVIEDFKKCDIFIPESANWNLHEKALWDSLSEGEISSEDFIQQLKPDSPDFVSAQARMIYNSEKPILLVDVPEGHILVKEMNETLESLPDKLKSAKNFDDVFLIYKESFLKIGELNKQREEIIVNSIPSQINSFLKLNPMYKRKKELNILIQFGSGHSLIFHTLKSRGASVQRKFQGPQFFGQIGEILRRVALGKEVPKNLIAQSILNAFIQDRLESTVDVESRGTSILYDYAEVSNFVRLFSYEEIEKIVRDGKDSEGLKKRTVDLCTQKNLEIPEFLK